MIRGDEERKTQSLYKIVSNESSEIIRMFNTAFNRFLSQEQAQLNYYPENLQKEIDENNEWIYDTINNGVYKSGFATTQAACKLLIYLYHCDIELLFR
jgi:putative glutathione S-transferase